MSPHGIANRKGGKDLVAKLSQVMPCLPRRDSAPVAPMRPGIKPTPGLLDLCQTSPGSAKLCYATMKETFLEFGVGAYRMIFNIRTVSRMSFSERSGLANI